MVPGRGAVPTGNIGRTVIDRVDPRWMVLAAAVLWGTTGTARALGPDDASPAALGAARIIVGGAILAVVVLGLQRRTTDIRWPWLPTMGAAAAMAAYQPLFFGAVDRTGVAVGTVVGIGSAPVLAGLLGLLVRGERPGPRWLAATGLALVGTALLVSTGDPADVDSLGVALAVGAGASYAVYILATKLLLDAGLPSDLVVAVTFAAAGLLLVPVAIVTGLGPLVSLGGLATVAHLGVLTVAVGYLLFGRGLRGVGVGTAGTLTLAEPATAATLAIVVLGERPGATTIAGLALIAVGLVLLVSIAPRPVRRTDDAGEPSRPT
jgi:DME family drug/metabolite transporter